MDIINFIKSKFKSGDALTRIIFINLAVFAVIQTLKIVFVLFNQYSIMPHFLQALLALVFAP